MRTTKVFGAALGCAALLTATTVQAASIRPGDSVVSARLAANTPMTMAQLQLGAAMEDDSEELSTFYYLAIVVGGIIVGYALLEIFTDDEPESPG